MDEAMYVELYDETVKAAIGDALNDHIMSTRYVKYLVRLPDGKWLVCLETSIEKKG